MALFNRKTKKETTAPAKEVASMPAQKTAAKHSSQVLHSPRVTEKGAYMSELGAYVFNVDKHAGKQEIARAVHAVFNVWPRKVRIVAIPRKMVLTRGTNRTGMTVGGKKAYVYLKKGETIQIV